MNIKRETETTIARAGGRNEDKVPKEFKRALKTLDIRVKNERAVEKKPEMPSQSA